MLRQYLSRHRIDTLGRVVMLGPPNRLGAADFELGIIAGDRSINLMLSTMIPGADDGKVSVERAKLDGMTDFMVMSVSHPFLMTDDDVIQQAIFFLNSGGFKHDF